MAAYLRSYVESVAELPSELARKFKLMRDLDERAHALTAEAEAASLRRLEGTAQQVADAPHACAYTVWQWSTSPGALLALATCRLRHVQRCHRQLSACARPMQHSRATQRLQPLQMTA